MKRVFLPFVVIVLSAAALISCSSTGKKQQPLNFQTAEIPADVVPEHFPLISIISTAMDPWQVTPGLETITLIKTDDGLRMR